MRFKIWYLVSFLVLLLAGSMLPYPIDGYETTGIPRLAHLRDIVDGKIKGRQPKPGALKSIEDIKLHLVDLEDESQFDPLPEVDPELQKQIDALFSKYNPNYSVTVLDITPGRPIRYAQRKETLGYQPGSVGKLAVAAGFFCELESIFPDDPEKRAELMRTKTVKAGPWALPNHHTVPFYDVENQKYYRRHLVADDVFTLYEWVDHMLSVSSNGAASVVWREAILMYVFGQDYPTLTQEEADAWFKETPRDKIREVTMDVVNGPLRSMGITEDEWRLGSLFTGGGKRLAPGGGGSTGTPVGLMKYLVAMERGKFIDPWTSLEVKRMIYMTDRRIRYASSPALDSAAVYYKSGSLYSCRPEAGFSCGKYKGNRVNYMNSVAIVEQPDGTTYIVAMMSNVLKKNSAWDHRVLAAGIDKLMREGEVMAEAEKYQEGKLEPEQ